MLAGSCALLAEAQSEHTARIDTDVDLRVGADRPVLIAASTLKGEEEPVLEAFQRIRATLFYDHQRSYFNDKQRYLEMRSAGAEIFADTKWWNQYPLTFGVRVSRLLDNDPLAGLGKGSYVWELVLPVAIIPR